MLVYIEKQPAMLGNPDIEAEGPYSVVLAPTRELAQQVHGCAPALLLQSMQTLSSWVLVFILKAWSSHMAAAFNQDPS
jgi:superfamily II DNA/RNA helicase